MAKGKKKGMEEEEDGGKKTPFGGGGLVCPQRGSKKERTNVDRRRYPSSAE